MSDNSLTDNLRSVGLALANGKNDVVKIPDAYIQEQLRGKKSAINPTAYIRQIVSRVPEVAEKGRVSVTRSVFGQEDERYGMTCYEVRLVEGGKRKVYNKAALDKAVAKAKRQVAESVLAISPSLANYKPEEYETLAKVVADIHAIIKKTYLNDEE